jgi:hypothetical protein
LVVVFFFRTVFLALVPAPVALVTVLALLFVPLDFFAEMDDAVALFVVPLAAAAAAADEAVGAEADAPGGAAAEAGAGAMILFKEQNFGEN